MVRQVSKNTLSKSCRKERCGFELTGVTNDSPVRCDTRTVTIIYLEG